LEEKEILPFSDNIATVASQGAAMTTAEPASDLLLLSGKFIKESELFPTHLFSPHY
jgi:hypothetical protein